MMNAADSAAPTATIQTVNRCTRLGSTFQPNNHSPRNVDSRKNAARPSMASGAPNTSPTNREYVRPVHPELELLHQPGDHADAMLISSSVPKNRVSRRSSGLPDRCHQVCSTATRTASPIVIGTKKKW